MAELPSGTVTFLFTDLEGSTRLWEEYPDAMRDALARHDAILRDAVESHGGYVVKTTGDGLHAVFAIAPAATAAAVDAQQRLLAEVWPLPEGLRVRMGLHTGHAEIRDGDYYGPAVNRAARVAAAPHGGQIVMSHATEQLVRDTLPAGCALVELGEHQLRDLGRAEVLFQVVHPDLPREFARLRTSSARKRRSPTLVRWAAVGVVLGVAAIGGVIVVASSRGGDERGAPAVPNPRGYVPLLSKRPCTPDESGGDPTVRCLTLTVPEDRSNPKNGRTVRLAVVRAPATDSRASATPTISIGIFTASPPAGDPLRSASTLIQLGLRGRGDSTPLLSCPELDASRAERFRIPWSDDVARFDGDVLNCFGRLRSSGMDISQYDDADVADDVRDLAFALKLPQISLRASNDSARAAVVVMRRYPGLLRAVLMNNANVPPVSNIEGVADRYDQSLSLLAQRCKENTACGRTAGSEVVAAVDAQRARFAADPQVVTVSTAAGPVDVLMDDDRFMYSISLLLGTAPDGLGALAPGNFDPTQIATATAAYLTDLLPEIEARRPSDIVEWCAEDAGTITKTSLETEAAAYPRFRSRVNPGVVDVCEPAGIDRVPELTTLPASSIPVFIVEGALTPWGPSRALSEFAAGLTHSSLLTLPNEGRNLDNGPPCAEKLRVTFLRDPTAHLDTKKCEAEDPPLPFAVR
jgi:class 3 adenylate cyclase/pimeloyl-ACP methyl ester carboxylesterase